MNKRGPSCSCTEEENTIISSSQYAATLIYSQARFNSFWHVVSKYRFFEGVNRFMKEVTKKLIIKDDDNYNEDKLRRYHLPIIKSVNQLLSMISFTSEDERKFFYSNNRKTFLYREITVPKRNGNGLRTIEIPDPKVKEIQQVLNKYIFSKFRMANSCHGFVKK